MRASVADYLLDFSRLGGEQAYAERVGYRIVRHTYGDVAETAFRFARELIARQIRKGDRVVLWGANSAEWVAAFFGCVHLGVIAVPIDDTAASDFALRVFQQVDAKLMVCSRDHSQPVIPAVFFEQFDETLSRHAGSGLEPAVIRPDDALQILFTS